MGYRSCDAEAALWGWRRRLKSKSAKLKLNKFLSKA
jgi:hypothetical protein